MGKIVILEDATGFASEVGEVVGGTRQRTDFSRRGILRPIRLFVTYLRRGAKTLNRVSVGVGLGGLSLDSLAKGVGNGARDRFFDVAIAGRMIRVFRSTFGCVGECGRICIGRNRLLGTLLASSSVGRRLSRRSGRAVLALNAASESVVTRLNECAFPELGFRAVHGTGGSSRVVLKGFIRRRFSGR